jgi:hypothetical protein
MKLVYAVLIGVLVAATPMWAAAAVTTPASGGYATWTIPTMHAVQSGVKSVSPNGNSVTLSNGMTMAVAPNVSPEQLQATIHGHALIIAMYHQNNSGQKTLEGFWIESGPLV